ncbi:MAG: restriction endonuclease [Lachnospiraceae bacterium]|nr:restriction endonuclease [Lachnospiraceae bacterium]
MWPEFIISLIILVIIILSVSNLIKNSQPQVSYDASAINDMNGYMFERYCAQLLGYNGFLNVQVTRGSGDRGVDIVCLKDYKKYAFQCKRQTGNITRKAVQEIYTGMAIYKCDIGVILTNSKFADSAIKDARDLGIWLWDGAKLRSLHFINTNSKNANSTNSFPNYNNPSDDDLYESHELNQEYSDYDELNGNELNNSFINTNDNYMGLNNIDSPKKEFVINGTICDEKSFEAS